MPQHATSKEVEAMLSLLEHWLSRRAWTFEEAASALSGVFPSLQSPCVPIKINPQPAWRGLAGSALTDALGKRETYLVRRWGDQDLSPQHPHVWLMRAVQIGEAPRWLTIIRRVERLCQLLPPELQEEARATSTPDDAVDTNSAKGGRERNADTYASCVRAKVREEWERRGMAGSGAEERQAFKKTMIEDFVNPQGPHGQVKPKKATEASHPTVRNPEPILDEIRQLSAR
jgi:hypothetical protein